MRLWYGSLMSLRIAVIYLRYFWPVVPAGVGAVGAAWLLRGLGLMWSVMVPVVIGGVVFLFFVRVQIAADTGA
ncbi:hypothetical protein SAMN03097708_01608 [Thiohalomonas denitrificans]|uniref:Uncharacterized protein n=1 Tax=Thiohalomonas denitrificans TaxID=415747 RepID=A0A1G5Q975_9GAMM|nr:hypothetical protein SAMN03097708_01608 [Thiohalomonas denitrificans]